MRKIIAKIGFLLLGLAILVPNVVLGTAGDVSFTAATTINMSGIGASGANLTISANSTAESMVVGTATIVLTMGTGDSITFTSTDRYNMTTTNNAFTVVCGTGSSVITITASTTLTIGSSACSMSVGGGGGGGGTSTPVTPAAEEAPAEEAAPTETAAGEGTATASGGGTITATTSEGAQATVEVPADAVSADTVITVTPVGTASSIAGDPPAGSVMVGGYVYTLSAVSGGEAITSFSEEITLTFTYTDTQISGLDELTLTVYRWDTGTSAWVALDSTVDAAANTVTATTTQFSEFALMGEEEEEEVPITEMTIAELKAKIEELKALIAVAMSKLAALLGTSPITGVPADFSFTTNLSQGMSINDVKYLQVVLNSSTETKLASSGVGSPGNETIYFGSLTKAGVIKFQEKYASEILAPLGLTSGTGLAGSATREKLNSLLGK